FKRHAFEPAGDDHLSATGDDAALCVSPVGLSANRMGDYRPARAYEARCHSVIAELGDDAATAGAPVVLFRLPHADPCERSSKRVDIARWTDVPALAVSNHVGATTDRITDDAGETGGERFVDDQTPRFRVIARQHQAVGDGIRRSELGLIQESDEFQIDAEL